MSNILDKTCVQITKGPAHISLNHTFDSALLVEGFAKIVPDFNVPALFRWSIQTQFFGVKKLLKFKLLKLVEFSSLGTAEF